MYEIMDEILAQVESKNQSRGLEQATPKNQKSTYRVITSTGTLKILAAFRMVSI